MFSLADSWTTGWRKVNDESLSISVWWWWPCSGMFSIMRGFQCRRCYPSYSSYQINKKINSIYWSISEIHFNSQVPQETIFSCNWGISWTSASYNSAALSLSHFDWHAFLSYLTESFIMGNCYRVPRNGNRGKNAATKYHHKPSEEKADNSSYVTDSGNAISARHPVSTHSLQHISEREPDGMHQQWLLYNDHCMHHQFLNHVLWNALTYDLADTSGVSLQLICIQLKFTSVCCQR